MPKITYEIQKPAYKVIANKKHWHNELEYVDVDVSEAVANFLAEDDKREQRYNWKKKKQLQAANINKEIFLDASTNLNNNFSNLIESKENLQSRNPLIIILEDENIEELEKHYATTMTSKQYDVFKYHIQGFNNTEIAKMLEIDESSVRKRLHLALRSAVSAYLINSNFDLFIKVQNIVSLSYNGNLPSKDTFDRVLSFEFFNYLQLLRPDQYDLVSFVLDKDYNQLILEYLEFARDRNEKK